MAVKFGDKVIAARRASAIEGRDIASRIDCLERPGAQYGVLVAQCDGLAVELE